MGAVLGAKKEETVPESRKRKNAKGRTVQAEDVSLASSWSEGMKLSPGWWAPVMVALFVIALVYLVVTYITGYAYPIPKIGAWNVAVGLGLGVVGLIMATRWK